MRIFCYCIIIWYFPDYHRVHTIQVPYDSDYVYRPGDRHHTNFPLHPRPRIFKLSSIAGAGSSRCICWLFWLLLCIAPAPCLLTRSIAQICCWNNVRNAHLVAELSSPLFRCPPLRICAFSSWMYASGVEVGRADRYMQHTTLKCAVEYHENHTHYSVASNCWTAYIHSMFRPWHHSVCVFLTLGVG